MAAAIAHAKYPQHGAQNFNWKGGRAGRPVVYTRAFKQQHPEIVKAHQAVASAIRNGTLTRPTDCASCLRTCRVDAHHWDYSKPLSVEWLCRKCHRAADLVRQRSLEAQATAMEQASGHAHVVGQPNQITHAAQSAGLRVLREGEGGFR